MRSERNLMGLNPSTLLQLIQDERANVSDEKELKDLVREWREYNPTVNADRLMFNVVPKRRVSI